MIHKALVCPGCAAVNDAQSGLNCPDRVPRPNDITVCAYCQTIAIVEPDGETLREAASKDLPPDLRTMLERAQALLRAKGLKPARGAN